MSVEPYKTPEEPKLFPEKSAFVPPKALSHSPKISPSSIPNPNPSVTATKQVEPSFANYGGYLYSVPGYSAFQPVNYSNLVPNQPAIPAPVSKSSDFLPFSPMTPKEKSPENKNNEEPTMQAQTKTEKKDVITKSQTDFEDHFTPEIVPASSNSDTNKIQITESKMSITSLTQGSGATVTVPSQIAHKDSKKKSAERFSLKTSIPISKIDMKCVNTTTDTFQTQSPSPKVSSAPFNSAFQCPKIDPSKIEIQSNIVIKTASKEVEATPEKKPTTLTSNNTSNNNINTLLNAAEAINKNDMQFRKPESKPEAPNEVKDPPPFPIPTSNASTRPIFNPINVESSKSNFNNKPPDGHPSEKNSILFIQNKSSPNPKMVLTIQQQNPQVLLQRTNFESKNMIAPSRLSSQVKKNKDENSDSSSKVVALKRLHQENCDENDFENLITENQIYGNKIVVKEKSQATLQEELKNKMNKNNNSDTKNVVLQSNFVYLSNVQFPANLMMIKSNSKITNNGSTKFSKVLSKDGKVTSETGTMTINNDNSNNCNSKNVAVSKEIHVLKTNNNVLQTISNKNNNNDIVFQSGNQKVLMNPQILYQVPMLMDNDNQSNQQFTNRDYGNVGIESNKTDYTKQVESVQQNDKLYIACPYQMDSKLKPKIVITNIRPKVTKVDEISSLDLYEKKKRQRRLKHLTNRENKNLKPDPKKGGVTNESSSNIITPDKMKGEIYKEFAETRLARNDNDSSSGDEYGEDELMEYEEIIKAYGKPKENNDDKIEFLSNFRLGTHNICKEKELERQERIFKRDSIAKSYIAAGRLDRLYKEDNTADAKTSLETNPIKAVTNTTKESPVMIKKKQLFLSQLRLRKVSHHYKEGYERSWQEVLKERSRRNRTNEEKRANNAKTDIENINFNPTDQLQILTEIKNSVNENNNLIKKRLDSTDENKGDSIKILAEKNFTELNRLSIMADRSVKLYSGQNTRKRDLTPGFDSENIQNPSQKVEQPLQKYQQINIPDISKIISLKSCQETSTLTSSQATSMDEPQSSAAGTNETLFNYSITEIRCKDVECQVENSFSWSDIESFTRSYKAYESSRKKKISELQRRTTALRVECAHVTLSASRESDRARALLSERQHLASEEQAVITSLQRLKAAIDVIRNYN